MPFLKDHRKPPRSQILENAAKKNGLKHAVINVVGDRYVGEWQKDLKTGKGAMLTRHRQLYEGDFLEGYRHGDGVLAYENDDKVFVLEYRGDWRRGNMHGFGVRQYKDGSIYVGNFKYGKRDGFGMMWYPDGSFYAGSFVNDNREGIGMLVRPGDNRYEGSWLNDMKHGLGKFIHLKTGQVQKGVWNCDMCIYSQMVDVTTCRQSAITPTMYPIPPLELVKGSELFDLYEMNALEGRVKSCISVIIENIQCEE